MPSIGLTFLNGTQRGQWLGDPGVESYEHERESFHKTGLHYAFQINTNADDWGGIGIELSHTYHSSRNYFGVCIYLKVGSQLKKITKKSASG